MEMSPVLIVLVIVILYVISSIKILAEYERGVIFRLGKLLPRPKGPGVILVFAPIDRMVRVGLRTVVFDVPPQDVITRDNVSVKVSAVVYFRVIDPRKAIVEVENYNYATSQLSQTTLRSVLGQVELDDLLSQRERLNQHLQQILDQRTDPWGVKVRWRSPTMGRRAPSGSRSTVSPPQSRGWCRASRSWISATCGSTLAPSGAP
jgi:regulator of protease activity HflC (stomatin/prohibitin superfamily)